MPIAKSVLAEPMPAKPALTRVAPVGAALALVLMAGCTAEQQGEPTPSPSPSAWASAPAGGVVARCEDAVAQEENPGPDYHVIADSVAVPASDRVLEPLANESGTGPTRLFAKWGLLVRTGTTVELSLLPGWDGRARIRWGADGSEPATAMTVISCPPEPGRAPWSVFTGGTWVIEADCVPIRISTAPATEAATVELSIGASCRRPGG